MKKSASYIFQNKLHRQGSLLIAGIDEVGRGSLAGPLVSAVVVLAPGASRRYFDSKMLNRKDRFNMYNEITSSAVSYGLGWVDNKEIDNNGLSWALKESFMRALVDMKSDFSKIIIDGSHNYLSEYEFSENIVKADSSIACVAAASIIAKHVRDEYMINISSQYSNYDFENNVGYGTAKHISLIRDKGLSDIHRKSFCKNLV